MKKLLFCKLLFFAVFRSFFLSAEPAMPGAIAATEGDPNALVAGCVNSITGDYVLYDQDLVVRGAVPLVIQRCYQSGTGKGPNCGWHFFPNSILELVEIHVGGNEDGSKDLSTYAYLYAKSGGRLLYSEINPKKKKKRGEWYELKPIITETDAVGLTNTASSVISGRTNIRNNRIFIRAISKYDVEAYMVTGEGLHFYYKKGPISHFGNSADLILYKEELPNGCFILYDYDDDKRPTFVKVVSPDLNTTFAWAKFTYKGPQEYWRDCHIETSDGRSLDYAFDRKGKKRENYHFYLREVKGSLPFPLHYGSGNAPKNFNSKLTEIYYAGKVQEKVRYLYPGKEDGIAHDDSPFCNRVKDLERPVGMRGEASSNFHFSYDLSKWREKEQRFNSGGSTVITGPEGFQQTIHWTATLRPFETYYFEHNHLLFLQRLVWGQEKKEDEGDLRASYIIANGQILSARSLVYDDKHNPTRELFSGNLSGVSTKPTQLNGDGQPISGESFSKEYSYSQDGRNLLLQERDGNGKVVRYRYFPATSLTTAILTGNNHSIISRQFFEYDGNHLLICEIADDGCTDDPINLDGVTKRLIKRTFRRSDGMPERIESSYFDPIKRQELPLNKIVLHYSPQLLIVQQDLYNAEGKYQYSLHFTYDDIGRVIGKTDPLGRETRYTYDLLGRCTKIEDPSGLIETNCTYDCQGNLVQKDIVSHDGIKHTERALYNALGHKTAEIDYLGNITRLHPDPYGRIKQIEYPNGSQETFEYDANGCPTKSTSRSGATKTATYNAYGKPIEVHYSDGSKEHFVYNLDGTLRESRNRLRAITLLHYDYLGRVTHKQIYSHDGTILTDHRFIFDGDRLIQEIDGEGQTTSYEYDGAGRKISEHKNGIKSIFSYDSLGRLQSVSNEDWRQEFAYDILDRSIAERTYSLDGRLQKETTYAYDDMGNKVETAISTSEGKSSTQTFYDAFHRPMATIDPTGITTRYSYDESTSSILRKTTIDSAGNTILETFGCMGEKLSTSIHAPTGEKLLFEEFIYDLAGNCIERKSHLPRGEILTHKEYDIFGKVLSLTEAAGSPEQKITRYFYTKGGLLEKVLRSNNETLHYTYDVLGRMILCETSNGDGYCYSYDKLGRIIEVEDLASGCVSRRSYDISGQISQEQFLHGLSLAYERDPHGRPLQMILPDRSAIAYEWDAIYLKKVLRLSQDGDLLYSHIYEQRDLCGLPIISTFPFDLGKETRSYDLAGRPASISTQWHTEEAIERNPSGTLTCSRTITPSLTDVCIYHYDSLQQLTVEKGSFFNHTFSFDPHSMLLSKDEAPTQTNALYQLLAIGDKTNKYDAAGRLIDDGTRRYRYDVFDRLIEVIIDKCKVEYAYDSWHRRMQKTLYTQKDGQWEFAEYQFYLYDGMLEIGSCNESGDLQQLRLLGITTKAEAGATIAIELDHRVYIPSHDLRGSISSLVKASDKKLLETYRYSAFGEMRIFDAQGQEISSSQVHNPWTYFGKRLDEETGLIYFGRRYYNPNIMTWITPDPAGDIDKPNLFAFLRGSPMLFYDAVGYASQSGMIIAYEPPRPNKFESTAFSKGIGFGFYIILLLSPCSLSTRWTCECRIFSCAEP